MTLEPEISLPGRIPAQRYVQIARGVSLLAIIIGLFVLASWVFDFRPLITAPLGVFLSLTILSVGLLFLNAGVGERVRAEQANDAAALLAAIVESSSDAIVGKDAHGNVTSWNAGAETIFGYAASEMLGRPVTQLIPPDRQDDDDKILARIRRGERMEQFETVRVRKDGGLIDVSMTVSPIKDSNGGIVGASTVARDITERKRAGATLREVEKEKQVAFEASRLKSQFLANIDVTLREAKKEKQEAFEASRLKSQFLANMSHEIRTPINGIIGMTELVLETDLDLEQREYLGMAKSSAHALLALINDILDFSKIEAGKLDLEAISFSLRDCIGMILKPLGIRADQKGIELTAEIPAEVPDHLVGDPLRLRQIVINLTDNAIKFTQRGDVMLRVALASDTGDGHFLHFSISDTGIGIPAAKQTVIFQAFAQADGSTTRTYGGTGLGLAIASQLIRQMGGRIWVESTAGKGTTFHFTARLPVRHTPLPDAPRADPRKLEGLRVLVADDNAINRRILHEMLTTWRMQAVVVASGAAALAEMQNAVQAGRPFPLALLDGTMPGMDGFMVAKEIRENAKLSCATVLMLSSAMPGGAASRCRELGVASYVTKPVSQSVVLDAILMAIGGAAAITPAANPAPIPQSAGGLRILLAEDNVVNRAVAAALLEKRGHSLTHAANGREAAEAAARETFDLIFMDVQMPEIDGFEATRCIRASEQATGRHTPIVAITAHAMAGDRQRCLDAGMDDYISKPIQKAELLALIERIFQDRRPAPATAPPASPKAPRQSGALLAPEREPAAKTLPIFTREKLLDQFDGDEALMARLIALFHENTPRLLDDIRGSVARRGSSDLACSAHAILGSLGAFGADNARRLVRELETQAHDEDYENTDRTFAALERETAEIHAALAAFAPARA